MEGNFIWGRRDLDLSQPNCGPQTLKERLNAPGSNYSLVRTRIGFLPHPPSESVVLLFGPGSCSIILWPGLHLASKIQMGQSCSEGTVLYYVKSPQREN